MANEKNHDLRYPRTVSAQTEMNQSTELVCGDTDQGIKK